MSFLFLFNHAGRYASTYTLGSGVSASDESIYDTVSGNRSSMHRTTKSSSEVLRQYVYSASIAVDYCVIARADLALTQNTTRLRLKQRASGGTWSYVSGIDYNVLTSSDLIGITSQDLVIPVTLAEFYGIALSTLPASGSEASQISKFYASDSYSVLGSPVPGIQIEDLPPYTYTKPIDGTLPYEIEKKFYLDFILLDQATITDFYTQPELFTSPFFLYDTTGDIWNHKLEHVILLEIEETFLEKDKYNLRLTFGRLKHYE